MVVRESHGVGVGSPLCAPGQSPAYLCREALSAHCAAAPSSGKRSGSGDSSACDAPQRDPPPYPAHTAPLYEPGYRQSYSGSETSCNDLSSTESLSKETRQDPQGQETVRRAPSPPPTNDSRPRYSAGSSSLEGKCNTWSGGNLSNHGNHGNRSSLVGCSHPDVLPYLGYIPFSGGCSPPAPGGCSPPAPQYIECSAGSPSYMNYSNVDIFQNPSYAAFNYTPYWLPASSCSDVTNGNAPASNGVYVTAGYNPGLYTLPITSHASHKTEKNSVNYKSASASVDIKNCNNKFASLPRATFSHSSPPPAYPGLKRSIAGGVDEKPDPLRRSFELRERSQVTGSQPDLIRRSSSETSTGKEAKQRRNSKTSNQHKEHSSSVLKPELDHATIAAKATQLVERLSEENRLLRKEIDTHNTKISKLEKFEDEIEKVQGAYDGLVKHTNKRENLEKVMRAKMKGEIKKISETNQALKDQLDKALRQLQQKEVYNLNDSELKEELCQKDSTMAKLIAQNREISTGKERLDVEVAAQRSTLSEQRAHIEVLDNALTNAHSNIIQMEQQLRLRLGQDCKVSELEYAVSQLQHTSQKREAIESRLRSRLEDQLKRLRAEKAGVSLSYDADEGISSDTESSPTSSQGLYMDHQDKESRILELEAHVLKWEQRFLEENALRQLAVDAASMPKDARIAALEQSSVETEKIIADSRHERLQHLEEVYHANRKVAELESSVKRLQAQLAEKDAMIRVLQRHSSLSGGYDSMPRGTSCSPTGSGILSNSPIHSSESSYLSGGSSSPTRESLFLTSAKAASLSPPPSALSSSMPASGLPSRQNSQVEAGCMPAHTKANSTGTANTHAAVSSSAHVRLLQQKLAAQAALFHSIQSGTDQLSKCLWQV